MGIFETIRKPRRHLKILYSIIQIQSIFFFFFKFYAIKTQFEISKKNFKISQMCTSRKTCNKNFFLNMENLKSV